jgi:hypothetical protein
LVQGAQILFVQFAPSAQLLFTAHVLADLTRLAAVKAGSVDVTLGAELDLACDVFVVRPARR